jgi:DtxR family transcriptional regulator, Mn-dependent transcriptional regulator
MPTSTVEDYVKTLYVEQQRSPEKLVALGKLASAMQVVPGTVTTMVRTLSEAGLVRYEPRVGVSLTEAGEKLALHVLRRHRLVELFLVEVLKFDWSEVHEEAEELEHAMSDKLIERMDDYLGRPTVDPHGDPIPSAEGHVESQSAVALSHCGANERVTIVRIDNQDPAFLKYADDNGLRPGAELTVVSADSIAGAVTVRSIDGRTVALGFAAADVVLVSRGYKTGEDL